MPKFGSFLTEQHNLEKTPPIKKIKSKNYQFVSDSLVVVLLVVVHPDLSQPDGVLLENVDACSPSIGRPLAEDVAYVGAGDDLQGTVAHPGLKK